MQGIAEANSWMARVPNIWWIAGLATLSWLVVAGAGALVLMGVQALLG